MSQSFTLFLVFTCIATIACGGGTPAPTKPAEQAQSAAPTSAPAAPASGGTTKKLTIAMGADPAFLHYIAAIKKGFFEKRGIQADLKVFDDGNVALDSLLTGNAEISATSELGGLVRRAKGGKIYVVGTGAQSLNQIGIVARESVQQPKDIEGKKVGVTIGSGGHYFFARYLKKFGIDQGKLDVKNIQAPEMPAALNRSDIDLAFTWNPWIPKAIQTVPGTRVFARNGDNDVYFLNLYLYFSQRMIDDPDLAIASLQAISEGADWIRDPANLEEGAKISAQAINVPVEDAKGYISNTFNFEVYYFTTLRQNFEEAAAFAKEIKIINDAPNLDEMIHPEFMQKAYPDKASRKQP